MVLPSKIIKQESPQAATCGDSNGYWGYRYSATINGKRKENKKVRNEEGKPFKTQKQAAKARKIAVRKEKENMLWPQKDIVKKIVKDKNGKMKADNC